MKFAYKESVKDICHPGILKSDQVDFEWLYATFVTCGTVPQSGIQSADALSFCLQSLYRCIARGRLFYYFDGFFLLVPRIHCGQAIGIFALVLRILDAYLRGGIGDRESGI